MFSVSILFLFYSIQTCVFNSYTQLFFSRYDFYYFTDIKHIRIKVKIFFVYRSLAVNVPKLTMRKNASFIVFFFRRGNECATENIRL